MKKFILGVVAVIVLLFLAGMFIPISFAGQVVELNRCDGGPVYAAGDRARAWKKNGDTVMIRHWQISSCALAVLEANRLGVKLCYVKTGDPILWLHQTKVNAGSKWIFRDEAKVRFGISSPVNGYRKLHAREVGIKPCPAGMRADRKMKPKAQVWRLR